MRKEVLIAIIIGAALGLVIAFGIWRARVAISPATKTEVGREVEAPITTTPSAIETDLVVSAPEDEILVTTDSINVEGRAAPLATVVVTTPIDQAVVLADETGKFSGQVLLEAGANLLLITAFDENDTTVEREITVTYSKEFKER